MDKKTILEKWKRWLGEIEIELSWLLRSQDIFKAIGQIYQENKNIQKPALFHSWLINNYADSIASGIRKLADEDKKNRKQAISLHSLIKDISQNPDVLTRQDFVSRYPKDTIDKELADEYCIKRGPTDEVFEEFFEKGQNQVSVDKLEEDMASIIGITKSISVHVDKNVAHIDKNREKFKPPPTFEDVDKALQELDRIYCKYALLLTGNDMITLKPVIQYDWKEVLRCPWIEA
jgi:hypothetical protein